MAPEEIRDMLEAEPFVPFRVVTSDGSSHDVLNPQHVFLMARVLYIGILANPGDALPDRAIRVDLRHVTQLIPLVQQS